MEERGRDVERKRGGSTDMFVGNIGCVPINSNDGLFVMYVPEMQKVSLQFVPLGSRGEADVTL
jgi:hypothetical protein